MKILVTGCNGQLGKSLAVLLERHYPGQSILTDIDTLDLTDSHAVSAMIRDNAVTHVINCAAYTAVDKAESEPDVAARVNVDAVTNIAHAAAESGAKVVHISTDYVFDGKSYTPYRESDKVNPISIYGVTKRKGEIILLAVCPDAIVIRTAWLYSEFGSNFVKTMLRLGRERESLGVVVDQIGSPTYAGDLAEAILSVISSQKWIPGTYHFTDEGAISWYDFAKAIHRIAGISECNVMPLMSHEYPTPAVRPHYSVLDKTLIKKTFGLVIPYWEDSLKRCIEALNHK